MTARTPAQLQDDMEAARKSFETWRGWYPNENAPDPEIEPDRPMFNFHSTHDFRDIAGDLKRDPGRDWEREQPEHTPGLGKR